MNGVQTGLKCKPNVKRCKRFVFAAHSPLLHPNTLTTKAISHFQADHILTRFVFPPLNAIGKYRQINYYKDSISAKIYLNATELKQQVEAILDSAYHVFKEKANIMKDLDQAVAAQAFEDRAKKIEPYINIDNNENE